MLGMSALFPKEVPPELLAETLEKHFGLEPEQFLVYSDYDELLALGGRKVAILCTYFRLNDFFPSVVELNFVDRIARDHAGFMRSLCFALNTWCLYEDGTLDKPNPCNYYKINRDGVVEMGLIASVMLLTMEDIKDYTASEQAQFEDECRALDKQWWWPAKR